MNSYRIIGVFTGKTSKLSNDFETSMIKHPRPVLAIRKESIDHDMVTNQKYHGGDMRVIHHYSQKNYNHLKLKFPEIAGRFVHGSFGENIVTEELTESELNIGDVFSLGSAKVQLTVCRRPCSTINMVYEDHRILKDVIETGMCGWFYRVLEEGEVKIGDELKFLERPFPNLPVAKLHEQAYGKDRFSDLVFLKKCLDTGLMDKGWKPVLEKLLQT